MKTIRELYNELDLTTSEYGRASKKMRDMSLIELHALRIDICMFDRELLVEGCKCGVCNSKYLLAEIKLIIINILSRRQ